MRLYWYPKTRSSRAVWMLEELGIEYELAPVNIRDLKQKADPQFRRASPMGKVPALADGDVRLAESAAICLYLADRYSSGIMAPKLDHPKRGAFLYWMFFAPGVLEPAMAEKVGGWSSNRSAHGWGDFSTMIDTLEAGVGDGPWLLGGTFTAADVMLGSSAAFLQLFDLLPRSPQLEAYIERCTARPAYQRAQIMDAEKR